MRAARRWRVCGGAEDVDAVAGDGEFTDDEGVVEAEVGGEERWVEVAAVEVEVGLEGQPRASAVLAGQRARVHSR